MENTKKTSSSVKKTTAKKSEVVKKVEVKDSKEEIKDLKNVIDLLTQQNNMLMEQLKNLSVTEVDTNKTETNPMRMIKVISLCNNELNLSQNEHGEGKVYKFNKLGMVRNIPANILDDIVTTHLSLAEKGYFYICDEQFIIEHGLDNEYKELIDVDTIETILDLDKSSLRDVLSTCKIQQLDTILDVIVQKVINKEINLETLEDSGKVSVIDKVCKQRKNEDYSLSSVIEDVESANISKR